MSSSIHQFQQQLQQEQQQDIIDTLQAMRRQEDMYYECSNCYQERSMLIDPVSCHEPVTIQTRNVLCDWANKIIDFCSLDRETVEIAMNYVDRFVQTEAGLEILEHSDRFQLLVVTALYLAIKVHETVAISSCQFEKISRNTFTADDVEQMEVTLLEGLEWHLHPPTSLCFVRLYLDLMPTTRMAGKEMKETAFILAKIQTELAVRDAALVSAKASTIAFSSLMNAFEALAFADSLTGSFVVNAFVAKVATLSLVSKAVFYDGDHVMRPIQMRLYQAIAKQTDIELFSTGPEGTHAPNSPTTPIPSTPPRRGVARTKSFEETPRSIISRTA